MFFYNLITGIKNIIKWFSVIWQDRNWDYTYLHILLLHKLRNMETFFRNDAYCMDANNRADDIKYAIELLQRIIDDNYTKEALEPFYDLYPDYEFKFKTEPCPNNPGLRRLIDKDTEKQKELLKKCYENREKLRRDDINEFYRFLSDHIEEWWD